ncbi:MAG: L-threonylcarbamoyladenylate synthase [Anaerolineaceae bacterium]
MIRRKINGIIPVIMVKTTVLSILTPVEMERGMQTALRVLSEGGIIAFPTDTVYGLAAPAFSPEGIEKLFQIKDRELTKAIPILIGALDQLPLISLNLPPAAQTLAARFWPGALTLVIPRSPSLPEVLSANPTVAVRMPDHTFARSLIRQSGPLATTSANLSGHSNPLSIEDVVAQLGGRVDLVLDGGAVSGGIPSTIVDCTEDRISILRQGAIPADDIFLSL